MAFVQRNQVNVGADPATIAFDSNVTAGSTLVVGIRLSEETVTIDGVTDSLNGGAWTLLSGPFTDATTNQRIAVYGFYNTAAGACTVSVNISAVETCRLICAEYSDRATTSALDQTNNSGFTGVTTTVNSGNITTTEAGEDLFGFLAINGSATTFTASGTLTEITETDGDRVGAGSADNQATGTYAYTGTLSSGEVHLSIILSLKAVASVTVEQEGFRWGVDDDTEAAHTFEAAQDTNITIADTQSRLLRVIVNTTGDQATTAYTLRSQKNGAGGYVAVPVGATSVGTTPLIEAADATESGSDTAADPWTVNYPNASTGDLLVFCISWDDATATTAVTAPAGPNSEVLTAINATPATDASTETRCQCWFTVATGTWTASTLSFDPNASEQRTAACIRVPAGEFDAATPIGGSGTNGAAGTTETAVLNAAFTAGASDGSGKLCTWTSADVDPQTVAANWTEVCNEDRGAVSGGLFTRNAAVTNSEIISAGTVSTIASDSWASVTFVVRAPVTNNQVYVATSGNIAAGGEATTARLTAPAGKTTSDFTTGRRWDNENGTDSIDIASGFYTEVEWLVALSSAPNPGDYFEFRVYEGASAMDTYTVTPRWTIPGGSVIPAASMYYARQRH